MVKKCGSSFRGNNRYTRKELDEIAKSKGIKSYKSKNMDKLCFLLGLTKKSVEIPKNIVISPKKPVEIPKNINRPCDSNNRSKNRYTRKELDEIAKSKGIKNYKSKNMTELCLLLGLTKKPVEIPKNIVISPKSNENEEDSFLKMLNISVPVIKKIPSKNENNIYKIINEKKIFIYSITDDNKEGSNNFIKNIKPNRLMMFFKNLKNDNDIRNLIIVKNIYNDNTKEYVDYTRYLNEELINLEYENKIFNNTFIVNFTNITTSIIYDTHVINVINVFSSNEIFYSNLSIYKFKFFEKNYLKNNTGNYMFGLNVDKISNKIIKYSKSIIDDFNIKKYNLYLDSDKLFRLMLSNIKSTDDIINYFINNKICSYTKLMQFTGTCWTNSVLNSLLLSHKYSLMLKSYYHNWLQQADKSDIDEIINKDIKLCLNPKYSLEKYLMIIIYNILIKEVKPTKYDNNLVAMIAAKLKHQYKKNSAYDKIITLKDAELYSKGGYTMTNFKFVYDFILGNDYKNIESINEYYNFDFKDKKVISIFMEFMKPKNINEIILLKNGNFVIENCILLVATSPDKWDHVICGYRCNGEYYIYDSNNVLLKHNWLLDPVCKEYLDLTGYASMKLYIISYINKNFI